MVAVLYEDQSERRGGTSSTPIVAAGSMTTTGTVMRAARRKGFAGCGELVCPEIAKINLLSILLAWLTRKSYHSEVYPVVSGILKMWFGIH